MAKDHLKQVLEEHSNQLKAAKKYAEHRQQCAVRQIVEEYNEKLVAFQKEEAEKMKRTMDEEREKLLSESRCEKEDAIAAVIHRENARVAELHDEFRVAEEKYNKEIQAVNLELENLKFQAKEEVQNRKKELEDECARRREIDQEKVRSF